MTVDAQLLRTLRAAGSEAVSGAELAEQLGISRAAVSAHVQDLRAVGYDIEVSPHRGYRLVSAPDLLHADDLLARLGETKVIGRDIQVFQQTTSTNDVVEKLARDEVAEGVVVFAESQTRGRGRLGRRWHSPSGKGLWFSMLLRPQMRPEAATRITVASGTALNRAIAAHTALKPEIKWPNDILLQGRKVAGILTELTAELDRIRYVNLGIGVDVNLTASDFPAELRKLSTSLKIESGKLINRAELAVTILRELDSDYGRISGPSFGALANEWESYCSTIGQAVTVRTGDREIRGRAESLSEDGALLLRTDHGHLERVLAGDVTLEA